MNNDFVEFVLDQLSGLRDVRKRRMFGAFGLYQGETFFGIVDSGRLYLLTDDNTRRDYEDRGMKAFAPTPGQVLKNYYEVPVDILEDDDELQTWVRRAVDAQTRRQSKRSPEKSRREKSK